MPVRVVRVEVAWCAEVEATVCVVGRWAALAVAGLGVFAVLGFAVAGAVVVLLTTVCVGAAGGAGFCVAACVAAGCVELVVFCGAGFCPLLGVALSVAPKPEAATQPPNNNTASILPVL